MTPKEDPEDRAARPRERQMSEVEDQKAGREAARGLTTDLRSIHGLKSNAFGNDLTTYYANPKK